MTQDSSSSTKIHIPNNKPKILVDLIKKATSLPGVYIVEEFFDGGYLAIRKPGYKTRDDFAVQSLRRDKSVETTLSYVDLFRDFRQLLEFSHDDFSQFYGVVLEVFGGVEPPENYPLPGLSRSGDHILKALKWIWAQEDTNYPMPRFQGRKMSGYRFQELSGGTDLETVIERSKVKGRRVPNDVPGVDYDAIDKALRI
jgi:hypothetical protein